MDRKEWIKEMRRQTEERYDTVWSPDYGEKWGHYPNETHQEFIKKLLNLIPQHSRVLDAACGAGRYMPFFLEQGHKILGIDQSQGMLDRARHYFPEVQLEKVGLQDMHFQDAFDGAICMDALENVSPEDWPLVMQNFQRALKPGGFLYFTLEMPEEDEVEKQFKKYQELGDPIIYGECPNEGGVYHYYPSLQQVREWVLQAGLDLVEEGEGNGYHHFLVRKSPA